MTFASVCSGIEAASVAWTPLGWRCAFLSEIEPFPCALLKHYWPDTPNYGDLNECAQWPTHAIDVLVGGTPCQDFSVAGQRAGLGGARGGLTMRFLDCVERYAPSYVVWENVPGVLSIDYGRAFGAFLSGLAKRGYGFAYRVLDAQYSGLAQRRERVFVVGCSGGRWQRAAAVLFDAPRLRWNTPPRRETGKRIAPTVEGRAGRSGANNFATSGGLAEIARSVRAQSQASHREDSETYVPVVTGAIRSGSDSPAAHGKVNGTDRAPLVAFAQNQRNEVRELDVAESQSAIRRGDAKNETLLAHTLGTEGGGVTEDGTGRGSPLIAHSLTAEGHDASEDGTGRGVPLVASPLCAGYAKGAGHNDGKKGSPQNLIPLVSQCISTHNERYDAESQDFIPVAYDMRGREGGSQFEGPHNTANVRAASGGSSRSYVAGYGVRRLTPREVERLFGFPDDYTLIPYRGKPAKDGPRYRALGNSIAVPLLTWLGRRIELVESLAPCGKLVP